MRRITGGAYAARYCYLPVLAFLMVNGASIQYIKYVTLPETDLKRCPAEAATGRGRRHTARFAGWEFGSSGSFHIISINPAMIGLQER